MRRLFDLFVSKIMSVAWSRPADFVIGGELDPYLRRWFVIPRNRLLNIYLHQFRRSDDDRALHDHPWFSLSIILHGSYREHTIAAGGTHRRRVLTVGHIALRSPWSAHRIEILGGVCWTLFITGPRQREWGFHCQAGWRPWVEFVSKTDRGVAGRGCE